MDAVVHTSAVTSLLGTILLVGQTAVWDYRVWNRGVSPRGHPWVLDGYDQNGRRRYHDYRGNRCLILWPVDRH